MDTNDDFYGKEPNLNCFYMHTNFEQKYPKMAIVYTQGVHMQFLLFFPIDCLWRNQDKNKVWIVAKWKKIQLAKISFRIADA